MCEEEGSGNSRAVWLDEVRHPIFTKVPPPTDEDWTLETAEAVGMLKKKKGELERPGTGFFGQLLVEACACATRGCGSVI